MVRRMLLISAAAVLAAGCSGQTERAQEPARFELAVTDSGFTPATLDIPAGKPVTLVVTRKTDQTCAKEILFPSQKLREPLPLDRPVEINLPASPKGEIAYTCGMDMLSGKLVVQ